MMRTLCATAALLAAVVQPAGAQEPYPTRPITIVVAFPPGGLADLTARPVALALERLLKQPVVVANKPGAAGAVGNQFVATSKPDGYTLLLALVSVSVLPEVELRLLAHTGSAPIGAYPDVPVLKSLGYDVEYSAWAGLVAPRNTPPNVIKILREGMRQAVKEPEVVNSHAKLDTPISYMDADEFNVWWAQDAAKLAAVVQKIGKVESAR